MTVKTRTARTRVSIALLCLTVYGTVVALVTLTPKPVDQGYEAQIDALLNLLHRFGVPEWFGYSQLEWSMNVAMFIPLGFCVTLLFPKRKQWVALLILPALSIAIETSQYFFLPARFATLEDVVANSIGGALGVLITVAVRRLVRRRGVKQRLANEHTSTLGG